MKKVYTNDPAVERFVNKYNTSEKRRRTERITKKRYDIGSRVWGNDAFGTELVLCRKEGPNHVGGFRNHGVRRNHHFEIAGDGRISNRRVDARLENDILEYEEEV